MDLSRLILTLPKDLGTARGDPLNLLLLRLLGCQAIAACCRAALEWWTLHGRRFIFCLNDDACRGPRGPYAPLDRFVGSHVDIVRLGRYGRSDVAERCEAVATCCNATTLRGVYSKLTGLGPMLSERLPRLSLRFVKFHQCRLDPADLAELLCHCEGLERLDCFGERLGGLGPELRDRAGRMPRRLQSAEMVECDLRRDDVSAFLDAFGGSLRSFHCQANNLHGLRVSRALVALEHLSLRDCDLDRDDALVLMAQCRECEVLELCGNPLHCSDDEDEDVSSKSPWPLMPRLKVADLRGCGLDHRDEQEFRSSLGKGAANLDLRTRVAAASPASVRASDSAASGVAAGRGHVVFEDSDSE